MRKLAVLLLVRLQAHEVARKQTQCSTNGHADVTVLSSPSHQAPWLAIRPIPGMLGDDSVDYIGVLSELSSVEKRTVATEPKIRLSKPKISSYYESVYQYEWMYPISITR